MKTKSISTERKIQVGDTIYDLDNAFLLGMQAARERVPFTCNPMRETAEQQLEQWYEGHGLQTQLMEGLGLG